MSRHIKISTAISSLALMMSMMACSDDLKSPEASIVTPEDNAITLSVMTEDAQYSTRSVSESDSVNRIYYAIYKDTIDNSGETIWIIDKYYHRGEGEKYKEYDYSPINRANFTVKLLPDPSADTTQNYRIVCWAHCAHYVKEGDGGKYVSDYYDLSKFPNVKVKYSKDNNGGNYINNDDARDAFYASEPFKATQKGTVVPVVLRRPFAQINIGTSGWDYEGLAYVEPEPKVVIYSNITITGGIASELDILNNKADKDETISSITYDFAKIPAYGNLEEGKLGDLKGIYDTDKEAKIITEECPEEFLKIDFGKYLDEEKTKKLNDRTGDDFADYIGWKKYDLLCAGGYEHEEMLDSIYTETFKYLSMSYVLVPFKLEFNDKGEETGGRTRSTVNIKFDCATEKSNAGIYTKLYTNKNVFELNNVPVQSNYRTNIIAADGTGFFMSSNEMRVKIYSETFADYYKRFHALDNDWTDMGNGGDNGSGLNGEYGWPGEDLEPEGPKQPLPNNIMDYIKIEYPNELGSFVQLYFTDTEHNVANLDYIPVFSYRDTTQNKKLEFVVTGLPEIELPNKDSVDEPQSTANGDGLDEDDPIMRDYNFAYKYKFYLKGSDEDKEWVKLDAACYEYYNDGYKMSIPVNVLEKVISSQEIAKTPAVAHTLTRQNNTLERTADGDLAQMHYYKLRFKIELVSRNENIYVTPSNNSIEKEIRVYRIIKSYQFTSDSKDEGGEIFRGIEKHENAYLGSADTKNGCESYEANSYFIYGQKSVKSSSESIEVISRGSYTNGATNAGKNDKLFALKDPDNGEHLRFRGASDYNGAIGHHIILKNLEQSVITIKMGRDQDQDNSGFSANENKGPYVREFIVEGTTVEGWPGYPTNNDKKNNENIRYTNTTDDNNLSSKLEKSDTRIMSRYIVNNSDDNLTIKTNSDGSGFSVYWILISEPIE